MGTPARQPHDLQTPEGSDSQEHPSRWEREAETLHGAGPEDSVTKSVTKSSRIYFFIILAVIAAAIAVFLILHPQKSD